MAYEPISGLPLLHRLTTFTLQLFTGCRDKQQPRMEFSHLHVFCAACSDSLFFHPHAQKPRCLLYNREHPHSCGSDHHTTVLLQTPTTLYLIPSILIMGQATTLLWNDYFCSYSCPGGEYCLLAKGSIFICKTVTTSIICLLQLCKSWV